MAFKDVFRAKVRRMPNSVLLEMLNHHKKMLADWRHWGDNTLRLMAEEAYNRGLID